MQDEAAPCAPQYEPDYSIPVVLWEAPDGYLRPVARAKHTSAFRGDFHNELKLDTPKALERGGVLLCVSEHLETCMGRVRMIVRRRVATDARYWHALPERAEVDCAPVE